MEVLKPRSEYIKLLEIMLENWDLVQEETTMEEEEKSQFQHWETKELEDEVKLFEWWLKEDAYGKGCKLNADPSEEVAESQGSHNEAIQSKNPEDMQNEGMQHLLDSRRKFQQ